MYSCEIATVLTVPAQVVILKSKERYKTQDSTRSRSTNLMMMGPVTLLGRVLRMTSTLWGPLL